MFSFFKKISKKENNQTDNNKNRILFIVGFNRNNIYLRMKLEMLRSLLDNPQNEIYILDCDNKVRTHCWISTKKPCWRRCRKCTKTWHKILKKFKIDSKHILKMQKVPSIEIPVFNSMKDAINFEVDGYNLGIGAISSIMTMTRDYNFDLNKMRDFVISYMQTCYITLRNVEKFHKIYNFNEINDFNARFPINYAAISFAIKNQVDYTVYDRGANLNKLWSVKNNLIHDFYFLKNDIKARWKDKVENKDEIAIEWFENRRKGKFQAWESFTKDQTKELLPKNFDVSKENIGIFNSSIDEVFAYSSWDHPYAEHDNILIKNILEYYKNDNTKHFYLRVHPNLTKAKALNSNQIKEINEFKNKYKNLTVIEPDDKIDTYALIDAVDKVVAISSTVGCEATYWGSIAILAGKAMYEDLDCAYKAKTMEEVYRLIDDKTLVPKPKENTYPYGYHQQVFGEEMKYYKLDNATEENIKKMKFV